MTNENERLKYFRNQLKLTQAALSKSLNIKQASLSDVERGKVKVSANLLSVLMTQYRLNPFWLVEGRGVMQLTEDQFNLLTSNIIYTVDDRLTVASDANEDLVGLGKNLLVGKDQYSIYLKAILSGKSQANLTELFKVLALPGIHGKGRTFELLTDSMAPELNRGDYAVCSPSSTSALLSHKSYFFVCQQDILPGRGKLKSDGKSLKISPNNKKSGKSVSVPLDEVLEVWEVKMKLTAFMDDPYKDRLEALEQLLLKKKKRK